MLQQWFAFVKLPLRLGPGQKRQGIPIALATKWAWLTQGDHKPVPLLPLTRRGLNKIIFLDETGNPKSRRLSCDSEEGKWCSPLH